MMSGSIPNAGGRCLRNIYGNKVQSLPSKVQASKNDSRSQCGYVKLQLGQKVLKRWYPEAIKGKALQIRKKNTKRS